MMRAKLSPGVKKLIRAFSIVSLCLVCNASNLEYYDETSPPTSQAASGTGKYDIGKLKKDIAELKKRIKTLRKTQETEMPSNNPSGVIESTPDGRIIEVKPEGVPIATSTGVVIKIKRARPGFDEKLGAMFLGDACREQSRRNRSSFGTSNGMYFR